MLARQVRSVATVLSLTGCSSKSATILPRVDVDQRLKKSAGAILKVVKLKLAGEFHKRPTTYDCNKPQSIYISYGVQGKLTGSKFWSNDL